MLCSCSSLSKQDLEGEFANDQTKAFLECAVDGNLDCLDESSVGASELNVFGTNGGTPLEWYLRTKKNSNLEVVKRFLAKGADAHLQNLEAFNSPYIFAIEDKNLALLELFTSMGFNPDHRYKSGIWTYPIHMAVTSRNLDVVNFLLDNGADIESKNHAGLTPLLHSNSNQYDIALELLKRGASIDVVDKNGNDICYIFKTPIDDKSEHFQFRKKFSEQLLDRGLRC